MTGPRRFRRAVYVVAVILLSACAALQRTDPLQVTVAGIEPLQGQGMELRMLVKLRVQNPNDAPIQYDGVSLKLDVQGNTFATGVSDERGSVPRFGESVISVPVTTSAMRMVRQALGMMNGDGKGIGKVSYALTGKLNGPTFGSRSLRIEGRSRTSDRTAAGRQSNLSLATNAAHRGSACRLRITGLVIASVRPLSFVASARSSHSNARSISPRYAWISANW